MRTRREFAEALAQLDLLHVDRAVALLWYYRHSQEYEERSSSDLANDLQEEGFPRPHVTRLRQGLQRSRYAVAGMRAGSFRINLRYLTELDDTYGDLIGLAPVDVVDTVLPFEWVAGTRGYLEAMVRQINGSYQFGFFDCGAVLIRRLIESLIIDVYIHSGRHHEIQNQGVFFTLDGLIAFLSGDPRMALGRNTPANLREIKQIGDTAAHDRVYVTPQLDIDDAMPRIRRTVRELLTLSGIQP